MSVENIVQEYLAIENKTINTIEILAQKHGLTARGLISLLKRYNIETPKLFSRMDVMEMNGITNLKEKYIKEQVSKGVDLDNDVSIAVSIQKYFHDLGFDKMEGSEKAKALCNYVKTQFGINAFDVLVSVLVNMIKEDGVFTLENNLKAINNGTFNLTSNSNNIENQIYSIMLDRTKDIFIEPEPEPPQPPLKQIGNEKLFENYLQITKPKHYNFLMKMKEIRKQKQKEQGFQIIKNALETNPITRVLEKPKPKISIVDKPKTKPKIVKKPKPKLRKKRKFTGEEVVKFLESA